MKFLILILLLPGVCLASKEYGTASASENCIPLGMGLGCIDESAYQESVKKAVLALDVNGKVAVCRDGYAMDLEYKSGIGTMSPRIEDGVHLKCVVEEK